MGVGARERYDKGCTNCLRSRGGACLPSQAEKAVASRACARSSTHGKLEEAELSDGAPFTTMNARFGREQKLDPIATKES